MFNVMYPRFTGFVATDDLTQLSQNNFLATHVLAAIVFPLSMTLAFFSEDLVQAWVGNAEIASHVAPVILFLSLGTAFHSMMFMPYAIQLAFGASWLPLANNLAMMVIFVPLVTYLAKANGLVGGGQAWLIIELMYLFIGTWLTHRYVFKGVGLKWLIGPVGGPFVSSLILFYLGAKGIQQMTLGVFAKVFVICILTASSILLNFLISGKLRSIGLQYFRQR
jgi:O-antigen/teichoic acid export membrane protein